MNPWVVQVNSKAKTKLNVFKLNLEFLGFFSIREILLEYMQTNPIFDTSNIV